MVPGPDRRAVLRVAVGALVAGGAPSASGAPGGGAADAPRSAGAPGANAASTGRRFAVTDSTRPAGSLVRASTRSPPGSGAAALAGPQGPFRTAEFDMVGVFDADWLLEPRYTRLLDHLAASPGAFGAVRFFGALNAGDREDVFPTSSGRVWPRDAPAPDLPVTLDTLAALISRGLVPFVGLTFFPAAIAPGPITPPADFEGWQRLVRAFLDAAVARFGAAAVAKWWFEAWNEPNMPPFWGGDFERYLELYRATSQAVLAAGHTVRLGGPAVAWLPAEGPALMRRFLEFLRNDPALKCDFLSLHRKGIWVNGEDEPRVERLLEAAEFTAEAALRLIPERCARGLPVINNEADMKVAFATPYAPRMDERFPAWLAANAIAHDALSARYADRGLRFHVAADNANQHLLREPFDGRRSLLTPTSAGADDQIKLPVFAFYELLRLLGDRHGSWDAPADAFFPHSDIFHTITVGEDRIAALFTNHPIEGRAPAPVALDYSLRDIPWSRVNIVEFRIDGTHANSFAAAGRRMPAVVDPVADARRLRAAAELGVAAPLRSGVRIVAGRLTLPLRLDPFATALVWMTPFDPTPPAAPARVRATSEGRNVILRWQPNQAATFYSYELRRRGPDGIEHAVSPVPLRNAMWVDTAPPTGDHRYVVRTISASGVRSRAGGVARVRV